MATLANDQMLKGMNAFECYKFFNAVFKVDDLFDNCFFSTNQDFSEKKNLEEIFIEIYNKPLHRNVAKLLYFSCDNFEELNKSVLVFASKMRKQLPNI